MDNVWAQTGLKVKPKLGYLSQIRYAPERRGWKTGLVVVRWDNNSKPQVMIKKFRLSRRGDWVPTRNQVYLYVPDFLNVLELVVPQVVKDLRDLGGNALFESGQFLYSKEEKNRGTNSKEGGTKV